MVGTVLQQQEERAAKPVPRKTSIPRIVYNALLRSWPPPFSVDLYLVLYLFLYISVQKTLQGVEEVMGDG
jgi:hypothetical protein